MLVWGPDSSIIVGLAISSGTGIEAQCEAWITFVGDFDLFAFVRLLRCLQADIETPDVITELASRFVLLQALLAVSCIRVLSFDPYRSNSDLCNFD